VHNFSREDFSAGTVVFQAGDQGDCAYVIEEGCVEVLRGEGANGQRVAMLAQGAMFGEVALLDRQPRTATIRAVVPSRLVRIERDHVQALLDRADPVVQFLLQVLLKRFRHSSGESANVSLEQQADVHAAAVRTLTLANDLAHAIDRNQLELFYQPIVHMADLSLAGYEALIRWRHPQLGMVNPMEFIPLAEKTGLVHRLGRWVLDRATSDWPRLKTLCASSGAEPPFMSVNFSAPELGSVGVVDMIRSALERHAMPPAELHVELTETIIINSVDVVSKALQQLRALGVGIALDDFGTGYAGLDYLQALPFSCIKIDKAFVQQMLESERSFQIVRAALELARVLGMSTVAEGVEDEAVAGKLADLGCVYGQGYHFGRPMPAAQLADWARARTGIQG
jgi:EAL domain-containing protein (putative c-di-GMP-specific phosphodiesterase class I)